MAINMIYGLEYDVCVVKTHSRKFQLLFYSIFMQTEFPEFYKSSVNNSAHNRSSGSRLKDYKYYAEMFTK